MVIDEFEKWTATCFCMNDENHEIVRVSETGPFPFYVAEQAVREAMRQAEGRQVRGDVEEIEVRVTKR